MASSCRVLVIAEFALCAVLLVAAGLFLRSLGHLGRVELGLDYQGVQSFRAAVGSGRDPVTVTDAIRSNLERLGGTGAVVATSHIPLSGSYMNVQVSRRDRAVPGIDRPQVTYRLVSPGYFEALGIRLARGRILAASDGTKQPASGGSERDGSSPDLGRRRSGRPVGGAGGTTRK